MAVNQVIIFKAKDAATGKIREVSVSMSKLNKVMGSSARTFAKTSNASKGVTKSLAAMGLAPRKAETAYESLRRTMGLTVETLKEASSSSKGIARSISAMGLGAKKATGPIEALTGDLINIKKAVVPLTNSINKLDKSLSSMGLAYKKPIVQTKVLESRLSKLRSKLNKLNPVFSKFNKGIGKGVSALKAVGRAALSLRGILFTLGAAYVVASGIRILKDLNATADSFELLKIKLDNLMGSAKSGKEAFKFIIDFAETTPLSVRELTAAFVKMKAFGLDPMDGSMRAIVDQTAKLSGGQKEMGNIILAVGQMWTEQKVRGQEVRQLLQQAVPVYQILADKMGIAASAVKKLGEEGLLGSQAVRDLIEGMGAAASGAAAVQMTTFTGLWNNFVDQIELAKDEFAGAEEGLLSFTKALTDKGIAVLKEFRESGDLATWGEGFGNVMVNVGVSLLTVTQSLVSMAEGLALVLNVVSFIDPISTGLRLTAALNTGAKRLARTFRGELGDAFDEVNGIAKPVLTGINADIEKLKDLLLTIPAAMKAARQEKLGREILSNAQDDLKGDGGLSDAGKAALEEAALMDAALVKAEKATKANIKNLNNQKALIELQSEFLPKTEFSALFQNELALKRLDIEEQISLLKAGALGGSGGLLADISAKFDEDRQAVIDSEANTQAEKLLAQIEADIQLEEQKQAHEDRMSAIGEASAQRQRDFEAKKIEISRRSNQINLQAAQGLGVALLKIAGASNKKIFAINKIFAVASILIDTQAAAAKAMSVILPPANFAVAAQIEADGFRRAAFAGAIGLAQGIAGGGGGGSSGGGGGNVPGTAPNFQQQQNQGSTINLTINAVDSKSFLDNVDEVLEPIAEKLADHLGANGSSGQFNFVLERS